MSAAIDAPTRTKSTNPRGGGNLDALREYSNACQPAPSLCHAAPRRQSYKGAPPPAHDPAPQERRTVHHPSLHVADTYVCAEIIAQRQQQKKSQMHQKCLSCIVPRCCAIPRQDVQTSMQPYSYAPVQAPATDSEADTRLASRSLHHAPLSVVIS
jgi:hypothetical protein